MLNATANSSIENVFDGYRAWLRHRSQRPFDAQQIRALALSQHVIWKSTRGERHLWSTYLSKVDSSASQMARMTELAIILMSRDRRSAPWEMNKRRVCDCDLLVATVVNFEGYIHDMLRHQNLPSIAAREEARAIATIAISVIVARRLTQPYGGNPRHRPTMNGICQVFEVLSDSPVDISKLEDRLKVLRAWLDEFLEPTWQKKSAIHAAIGKLQRLLEPICEGDGRTLA